MRSVGGTIAIVYIVYCHVISEIMQFRTVYTAVREGGVGFLFLYL